MSKTHSHEKAPIVVDDPEGSRDNEVRPFALEGMDVRGRAVRLGTVAEQVLSAHDYPDPVARILGEMLALVGLLGSILKRPGMITVQTKSEGPVPMMVADYELKEDEQGELKGYVRGYADIDAQKYATYGKNPSFKGLIGSKRGYLALTIDPGEGAERYQGIVDLAGETLSTVSATYFVNSEQTPTAIELRSDRDPVTGHWRAGGVMVQHLSRGEEGQERILTPAGAEEWNRANILLESVKTEELLDPQLDLDGLLFRLYHEDGVRVFEPMRVEKGCRCDRARLRDMLNTFGQDDIDHMTVDGQISVNCQFCNKSFDFDPAGLGAGTS